jgi:hypothetical protein
VSLETKLTLLSEILVEIELGSEPSYELFPSDELCANHLNFHFIFVIILDIRD